MKKITNFDKLSQADWTKMRNVIKDALKKVGDENGICFELGNFSYLAGSFKTQLKAAISSGDETIDKYAAFRVEFNRRHWRYNFDVSDFMREFDCRGITYRLLGWKTTGRVIGLDSNGQTWNLYPDFRLTKKDLK
jgi:hypothetical protein